MMTHSSKKPFECKFIGCAKSYCDARSLRRHLENHHHDFMSATATAAFDAAAAANMFDGSSSLDSTAAAASERSLPAPDVRAFNATSVWTTGYNPLEYVLDTALLAWIGSTSLYHCRQCSIVLKPRTDRIDSGFKKPGFFLKAQRSGFFWVLLGFLDKQEKIGKIIQKLSNLKP